MINQVQPATLDSQIMAIGINLNQLLNVQIANYAALIISIGIAGLQASPYSKSVGDATDLFNAAQDLDNFRKVYGGLGYVTLGATVNSGVYHDNNGTNAWGYPFNINVKKCTGLGY